MSVLPQAGGRFPPFDYRCCRINNLLDDHLTLRLSLLLARLTLKLLHAGLSHTQATVPSHTQATGPSHTQATGPSHTQATGPSHTQATALSHTQATCPSHTQATAGPSHTQTTGLSH